MNEPGFLFAFQPWPSKIQRQQISSASGLLSEVASRRCTLYVYLVKVASAILIEVGIQSKENRTSVVRWHGLADCLCGWLDRLPRKLAGENYGQQESDVGADPFNWDMR